MTTCRNEDAALIAANMCRSDIRFSHAKCDSLIVLLENILSDPMKLTVLVSTGQDSMTGEIPGADEPKFWRDGALAFVEGRSVEDACNVHYAKRAHDTFSIGVVTAGSCTCLNGRTRQRIAAGSVYRVTRRYVAGRSIEDALERVLEINRRGHAASADYMGESCRDESKANTATEVFLALVAAVQSRQLDCSISLDLSHIGSLVDPELGYRNVDRIARAAAESGREVMISMEGSDRVDNIYATYARLHIEAGRANVGITVPAKLYRSDDDLPKLMAHPGRIRLIKGAFLEDEQVACGRDSPELAERYRRFAVQLLSSGHRCSIATHDPSIQHDLTAVIRERGIQSGNYEFESLLGLGTVQIDELHEQGSPTREYCLRLR
jgi:proline dehydrogenase